MTLIFSLQIYFLSFVVECHMPMAKIDYRLISLFWQRVDNIFVR